MVKEVKLKRDIPGHIQRELWARAAGRCQFDGHNRLLYTSCVTQESVNSAQKAHIYAFSENGPRRQGPYKENINELNDVSNLMLVCYDCHKKIDQEGGDIRYPADLLINWKNEHEKRIEIVTGISLDKKSNVVIYGANIGSEKSPIEYHACVKAMFPQHYPASERPIMVSMTSELKDSSAHYWQAESQNLLKAFNRKILAVIEDESCKHFSVFSLAPQPLLIQLGALLTDKIDVETYQLHREPRSWNWVQCDDDFEYVVRKPENLNGQPVLILSLSDNVTHERITRVLGNNVSIWEITIEAPNNDFMQAKQQLSMFRKQLRKLIAEIKQSHGESTPLNIFPVMPVSCAIELGRIRMPKADMPWMIFDHNIETQEFVKAIELRGDLHA